LASNCNKNKEALSDNIGNELNHNSIKANLDDFKSTSMINNKLYRSERKIQENKEILKKVRFNVEDEENKKPKNQKSYMHHNIFSSRIIQNPVCDQNSYNEQDNYFLLDKEVSLPILQKNPERNMNLEIMRMQRNIQGGKEKVTNVSKIHQTMIDVLKNNVAPIKINPPIKKNMILPDYSNSQISLLF